tara:strand:- start:90 stop:212 length:123 start_codon:yes stop_codon:yes gene_type:complete
MDMLTKYRLKQHKQFRRRVIASLAAIGLIAGAFVFWYYYG